MPSRDSERRAFSHGPGKEKPPHLFLLVTLAKGDMNSENGGGKLDHGSGGIVLLRAA